MLAAREVVPVRSRHPGLTGFGASGACPSLNPFTARYRIEAASWQKDDSWRDRAHEDTKKWTKARERERMVNALLESRSVRRMKVILPVATVLLMVSAFLYMDAKNWGTPSAPQDDGSGAARAAAAAAAINAPQTPAKRGQQPSGGAGAEGAGTQEESYRQPGGDTAAAALRIPEDRP